MIELKGRTRIWYLGTKEEKEAYNKLKEVERKFRALMLYKGVTIKRETPIDLGFKDMS